MALAIDIGNTNIVLGCFHGETIHFIARIATERNRTAEQYAAEIKSIIQLYDRDPKNIDGSIISSVVPPLTGVMKRAVEYITGKTPLIVTPTMESGVGIQIDDPNQLGADLLVAAVASVNRYPLPQIIIDMGTATTVGVVDETKTFIGGMIVPGVMVSLNALAGGTAQLPHISLDPPKHAIGRNTVECMQNGIIYHNAAGVDGMIERIEAQLGKKCTVVITGGLSTVIAPHCKHEMIHDPELLLKGLMILYRKNARA